MFLNLFNGLVYITKTLLVISQRGTASLKTRSRILSLRPRSLTTSTLSLKNDSSSRIMADWLNKVEPGINSTRISTSLFESASPLATEPKILTLRAPCFSAIFRIPSRLLFLRSSISINYYKSFKVIKASIRWQHNSEVSQRSSKDCQAGLCAFLWSLCSLWFAVAFLDSSLPTLTAEQRASRPQTSVHAQTFRRADAGSPARLGNIHLIIKIRGKCLLLPPKRWAFSTHLSYTPGQVYIFVSAISI